MKKAEIKEAIGIYKAGLEGDISFRVFHRKGYEDKLFKKQTPALEYARELARKYGYRRQKG